MAQKSLEVIATLGDERVGIGRIWIEEFNSNQKLGNALKKISLFWLAALFCVLIPGLHFVLVPLFFIVGLVSFSKTLKINGKVIKGQTDCPFCKNQVKIHAGLLNWPLKEICQKCGRALRINKK